MVTQAIKWKTMMIVVSALLLGLVFQSRSCSSGISDTIYPNSSASVVSKPVRFDLDQIIQRGKLIALTDYSSTSYFIYKGEPMGFEYEMLNAYAHSIGVKLQVIIAKDMDRIFSTLNKGEADIVAANLTVTQERSKIVTFSDALLNTRQVLVQRKPDNWKRMTGEQIEKNLIRNTVDLGGKVIHVRKGSSFYERLQNLSSEIGSEIYVIPASGDKETEQLIAMVADGRIDYTIADENVALINQSYYPNIDIKTAISFPQHIAWAIRKNSYDLERSINEWMVKEKETGAQNYIFNKYFHNTGAADERIVSDYFSLTGDRICQYDDIIKTYSKKLKWDWRLLASLIYEESHFNAEAQSWAGAYGLMQMIPATSTYYGIDSVSATPLESIRAGTTHLLRIDNYWSQYIPDTNERIKFDLASYNVGLGHIIDARNLASKYGKEKNKWENNVAWCLLMKSNSKYFNDPLVKFGYCRGAEPCAYVSNILLRYDHYCNFIKEKNDENLRIVKK